MKILLKSSIVGFLVGFPIAFGMLFVRMSGQWMYYFFLGFLLDALPLSEELGWIIGPLFFVGVCTLYGFIIGVLIQILRKNPLQEQ